MAGSGSEIAVVLGEPEAPDRRARLWAAVVVVLISLAFVVLIGRLVQIQLLQGSRYRRLALQQQLIDRKLSPLRGNIYDCKGRLLATSMQRNSIFADPTQVQDPLLTARLLARVLGLNTERLMEKLSTDRLFVWIKRQVTEVEAANVRRLQLPGVHMRREGKRVYPQGTLAAHVIGFTDIDGRGLEGVELEMDSLLSGRPGWELARCDAKRRLVLSPDCHVLYPPANGCDVYLTIDSYVQNIVEEELAKAADRHAPECAMAVVVDPRSGRVLAMANWPSFNPARPASSPPSDRKNRVVTDVYEFGSVLKPFTIAAALEEDLVTPQTQFQCHQGAWRVGKRTVHDVHPYGVLTVSDIICKSSNIGAAQVGMKLGKERFCRHMADFGFGRPAGIALPGEAAGILRPLSLWNDYSVVSISFGQEIAATPLCVARAFCTFANGGLLVKPHIVERVTDATTGQTLYRMDPSKGLRRVLSPRTAAQVMAMMVRVVEEGTGKRARVDGYTVAGKTGTAQLMSADGRGYSSGRYLSSFVGVAPAEDPVLVVLVSLKAPSKNGYYGGTVAAPACQQIIRRTLGYMAIPPRNLVQVPVGANG